MSSVGTVEEVLEVKRNSSSWRDNGKHFRCETDCQNKPGTASMAIAWFQQGWAVGAILIVIGETFDNNSCRERGIWKSGRNSESRPLGNGFGK